MMISKDICEEWIDNPFINPITKKSIKITSNGIYAKFEKACKDHGLAIPNRRMDTYESRIETAKAIRGYVSRLAPCVIGRKKLALVEIDANGDIHDKIYFEKRIGSKSKYGIAFANRGIGASKDLVFSAKITSDVHSMEIKHLETMSQLAENNQSPNMPITYKVLHCNRERPNLNLSATRAESILKEGKYYVILNELADGDLRSFLLSTYTFEEYQSIILQALVSLHTFHINTKYIHDDAHLGNFLYHKIKKGGYWWYKHADLDLYIPNLGYQLVLWDPGLTKPASPYEYTPYNDFKKVLALIGRCTRKSYSDKCATFTKDIMIPFDYLTNFYKDDFIRFLEDQRNRLRKKQYDTAFKGILFELNGEQAIINTTPYPI